uniref:Uncharacterized protein n=1 Tax=Anguilla anguilla TaxID=7936 RepID=A0A0E9QPD3_ANGAN
MRSENTHSKMSSVNTALTANIWTRVGPNVVVFELK